MKLEQPTPNIKAERLVCKSLPFWVIVFLVTSILLTFTALAIEGTIDYITRIQCQYLLEDASSSGIVSVTTKSLAVGLSCIENKVEDLPPYLSLKSNFNYLNSQAPQEPVPLSIQNSIRSNVMEIEQFSQAQLTMSCLPLGVCFLICFVFYFGKAMKSSI